MDDFDYFSDAPEVADAAELAAATADPDLEELVREARRIRRNHWRTLIVSATFLAVAVWFAWGFRDLVAYAFAPVQPPLELGDVSALRPEDIPHNRYVTVHGITEHRGLRQKTGRGLSLTPTELWYFRLLGSRGVFIEVLPDAERYGFTTEVTATGRAVDPQRAPLYADLLASYRNAFAAQTRAESRIIQVDMRPGEGRLPYYLAGTLLGALGVANLVALMRVVWSMRRGPRL